MKKLIIKSSITSLIFLLIILMFLYIAIFNPLYRTLEDTLLENFLNISEVSKTSFDNMIERSIENSKSISSRTMIKNKIIDYKEGRVNLEELKDYTQPKYLEGIEALENVIYSCRLVDKEVIASSGERTGNLKSIVFSENPIYQIEEEDGKVLLYVYSPIKSESTIGMDLVVYDLSNYLPEIESSGISIDIIKEDEIKKYHNQVTRNPLISEYKDPNGDLYLNVFHKIDNENFLYIHILRDSYYYQFDSVTRGSARKLAMVLVFSFFSINIIIVMFANEKIVSLDKISEKHKKESYYDNLTGAYSRTYLDQWIKDNYNNRLQDIIVFIDMDNFKDVNDKYGHQKGDELLKKIVETIKKEVRDKDFIIRFGGDEFIILLDNVSKDAARKVIKRINLNLDSLTLTDIDISFSYGLGELTNTKDFHDVLEEIDREMYQMKNNNRR